MQTITKIQTNITF